MKSKDPSTKVGAVIVGPDNEIRATGYNGFPRFIGDDKERYDERLLKYKMINHAEENAIIQCALVGVSSKGCSIYVPWIPCSACAKLIIQAGIEQVIYHSEFPGNRDDKSSNWHDHMELTKEMLSEAQIPLRAYSGPVIQLVGLYNGGTFEVC